MTTRKMDSLASFGVDINARSFLLDGDVDDDMLRTVWQGLAALGISKPIQIYLNSGGGDLDVAFGIYDILRNYEQELSIVVVGSACSAATVILQAADRRLITENSYLMVHEGSVVLNTDESQRNLDKWSAHYKVYTDKMMKLYAEKMNQPVSRIKKLLQTDQLYIGEEAVKAGLVDAIWMKK